MKAAQTYLPTSVCLIKITSVLFLSKVYLKSKLFLGFKGGSAERLESCENYVLGRWTLSTTILTELESNGKYVIWGFLPDSTQ